MGLLLRTLAFDYEADFDWMSKRLQGFEELTYEEFLSISRSAIGRNNKQRLAILMKGNLPEEDSFYYFRVKSKEKMKTISDYITNE